MAERQTRGGILILGGGFAGAWVARLLGKRGHESTIVNHENFMLFASLLPKLPPLLRRRSLDVGAIGKSLDQNLP